MKAYRSLHGHTLKAAQVREALFNGRPHLVVPIVALVEGVIHASNAEDNELVTAAELTKTLAGWNGRPAVLNHPELEGGQKISANQPETLEEYQLGQVFNAEMIGNKLTMEAWLDIEKSSRVAGGQELLDRARAGEVIEVSVGAHVDALPMKGVFKGKPYAARWSGISPDHLALLPEGLIGACSVEMGCGVRAASREYDRAKPGTFAPTGSDAAREGYVHRSVETAVKLHGFSEDDAEGLREHFHKGGTKRKLTPRAQMVRTHIERTAQGGTMNRAARIVALLENPKVGREDGMITALNLATEEEFEAIEARLLTDAAEEAPFSERILELLGKPKPEPKAKTGMSDMEVRSQLEDALKSENGFVGLDAVFPDDDEIVYMVMAGDRMKTYQRSFTRGEDGAIELGDDATEVVVTQRYEPVDAAGRKYTRDKEGQFSGTGYRGGPVSEADIDEAMLRGHREQMKEEEGQFSGTKLKRGKSGSEEDFKIASPLQRKKAANALKAGDDVTYTLPGQSTTYGYVTSKKGDMLHIEAGKGVNGRPVQLKTHELAEVGFTVRWAVEKDHATGTGCACHKRSEKAPNTEGEGEMDKTKLVKALIASDRNAFTDADAESLESFSVERLTALVAKDGELVAVAKQQDDLLKAAQAKKSPEAWLEEAPAEVRALLDNAKAVAEAEKTRTITALRAALPETFSIEELQTKTPRELADLLKAARVAVPDAIDRSLAVGGGSQLVAAGASDDPEPQADMTTWFTDKK